MSRAKCFVLLAILALRPKSYATEPVDFDRQVAPVLASRCIVCHNRNDFKGELDLTRRESATAGGASGAVIVAGELEESLLWHHVSLDEMPPENPLTDSEKKILKQWIQSGAAWGTDPIDPFQATNAKRAGYDWWSLQPLTKPTPPVEFNTTNSPIDAFVRRRLQEVGLSASPPAQPRALVRRLSFDLLGLPPDPEATQAFLENPTNAAYEQLVDKMLRSPHYGERWGRHWLDVARFGESDGFEYDKLRPNAWRYRDWVIRALNNDLPYDEFVRWQIAGDVIEPDNPDAVIATGFLVCGAHDSLLPAGDIQRAIMRQDELEDLVATVSQTCLGLTVNCARCHDHKFDPILQLDYYRLSAALSGVRRGDRPLPLAQQVVELDEQIEQRQQTIRAIQEPARQAILQRRKETGEKPVPPSPLAQWRFDDDLDDSISRLTGAAHGPVRLAAGQLQVDAKSYLSSPIPDDIGEKTLAAVVLLDDLNQRGGAAISLQTTDGTYFDAIVFGEREEKHWMAGSDGYARTKSLDGPAETEADKQPVHIAITYQADGTITCYRNGQLYGTAYKTGFANFARDNSQVLFGLRHGTGVTAHRMLSGGILEAALYDHALSPAEVLAATGAASEYISADELLAELDDESRTRLVQSENELTALRAQRDAIANIKSFAVTPNANPGVAHLLVRGNPKQPAEEVAPGGIAAVVRNATVENNNLPRMDIPADAPDSARRGSLADWITSSENPLFSRTIVNRVWHYHFGQGLISTPNDLGFNGGQATHPELLDWLAATLIENQWSLKQLHRAIVMSATYRQSSRRNEQNIRVDAGNRFLWRMPPRRLEAEAVRDAVLVTAGQLNTQVGGAPYQDWNMFQHKGGWNYAPLDPDGAEFHRRSIYRTWARGGRNPLLDTFDCPDPSATSPARGVTTTPLQALSLLNSSFVLRMSAYFAERVEDAATDDDQRVEAAFQMALGRQPSDAETGITKRLVQDKGLAALCRALLNSNEFLYVD